MTAVKEKIIGAVTVMTDAGAESFWHLIEKNTPLPGMISQKRTRMK